MEPIRLQPLRTRSALLRHARRVGHLVRTARADANVTKCYVLDALSAALLARGSGATTRSSITLEKSATRGFGADAMALIRISP